MEVCVCFVGRKGGFVVSPFDSNQPRDPVDLSSTFHPSQSLTIFAFRSREVKRHQLDLDSYFGTVPLHDICLLYFLNSWCSGASFDVVFLQVHRLVRVPACWRMDNVIQILKGPPSSSGEELQANFDNTCTFQGVRSPCVVRLDDLWNAEVWFQPLGSQTCRNGLGTFDFPLCGSYTLQCALEWGRRLGLFRSTSEQLLTGLTIRYISSSSTLYMCVRGSFLSFQFLSNR